MREATTITALLAAGAVVAMLSIGPAAALDRDFRYNPSELESLDGARQVYGEIHEIAEEICFDQYGGHRLVKYRAARERCVAEVVDDLVYEVDHPRLSQLHASQTRR